MDADRIDRDIRHLSRLESIQNDFLAANFRGEERDGPSVQGLSQEYGIKPLAVEDVLSLEDERVVVFCRSDGMGRNGIPYSNQYCWIVTVRDDKIASMVEFCDTALIEQVQFDKKVVTCKVTPLQAWSGTGSVAYDVASAIDPWHTLPVRKVTDALYMRSNMDVVLRAKIVKKYY